MWLFREFRGAGHAGWWMTRLRRSANPARPNICLLISLIFVDVAFHGGRAAGQGQAGGDGLLVAADAAGEGAELGHVAGLGSGEPVLEFEQALAAGHDLGEGPDVAGEVVQARAPGRRGIKACLVGGVEVVGVGEQPAGDLAGLGRRGGGRGLEGVAAGPAAAVGAAELADVAPGGLDVPVQPRAAISRCRAAALVTPWFQRWLIQGLNGSSFPARPVALTSSR